MPNHHQGSSPSPSMPASPLPQPRVPDATPAVPTVANTPTVAPIGMPVPMLLLVAGGGCLALLILYMLCCRSSRPTAPRRTSRAVTEMSVGGRWNEFGDDDEGFGVRADRGMKSPPSSVNKARADPPSMQRAANGSHAALPEERHDLFDEGIAAIEHGGALQHPASAAAVGCARLRLEEGGEAEEERAHSGLTIKIGQEF